MGGFELLTVEVTIYQQPEGLVVGGVIGIQLVVEDQHLLAEAGRQPCTQLPLGVVLCDSHRCCT